MEKNNHRLTQRLRWLTLVGMMSALTYILYLPIFRIPIILFLQLNFSEVVIFIGVSLLDP
jgi:riboflavin transporter FmnP